MRRRKWKLVLFLGFWPRDDPAQSEVTAPTGSREFLQETWEPHSCGLQRHLAGVMEKWHQNLSGHPQSPPRLALTVLNAEVTMNKHGSVLEKFTVHTERQPQVLQEIYPNV